MREHRESGFTLIELLVAVALMAVLAVLSWRGLDSVLRSRDQIMMHTDDTRALAVLFSQLDEDLRRAWPVRLIGIARGPIVFRRDTLDGPIRLDLLREAATDSPVQLERVVYRIRDRLIERGFGPWRDGAAIDAASLTWQPVLADVDAIEWRAWLAGRPGWQTGSALASDPSSGAAAAASAPLPGLPSVTTPNPETTPSGVELSLQRHGERFTRLFAVRD